MAFSKRKRIVEALLRMRGITVSDLFRSVFESEPGVTGFFSTAAGGSPKSPYYNKKVLQELKLEGAELVWPEQLHGAHIAVILRDKDGALTDAEGISFPMLLDEADRVAEGLRLPATDALITDVPNVLLTTVHADCVPICLYDPEKRVVSVVHGGWRGTSKGIAEDTVRKMQEVYGCRPEDIKAWVGPGISKCCFEVGEEVLEAFLAKYDWAEEFAERRNDSLYLDIKGINERQLELAGVKEIEVRSECTCCNPEFCSYRRDGSAVQRMGAGICLTER